jgi:ribosome-binding ATPase
VQVVPTSALAECFLRKLSKQGFVRYAEGTDRVVTSVDDATLRPMDGTPTALVLRVDVNVVVVMVVVMVEAEKTKEKVEKIQDLVMLRYGGTGVAEVVRRAVDTLGFFPVFVVRNIHNFTCGGYVASVMRASLRDDNARSNETTHSRLG